MDWGPDSPIWMVIFWVNVVVCSILAIVVVRVVRKYESRRKQLEKDIKTPGLRKLYMNDFNIHESEWAWVGNEIDYRIDNNTSKEGLKNGLVAILTTRLDKSTISTLHNGELNEIIK